MKSIFKMHLPGNAQLFEKLLPVRNLTFRCRESALNVSLCPEVDLPVSSDK